MSLAFVENEQQVEEASNNPLLGIRHKLILENCLKIPSNAQFSKIWVDGVCYIFLDFIWTLKCFKVPMLKTWVDVVYVIFLNLYFARYARNFDF